MCIWLGSEAWPERVQWGICNPQANTAKHLIEWSFLTQLFVKNFSLTFCFSRSRSLEEAQSSIMELFTQIRDIKAKAAESEAMVRDITRDIKQVN
jgi:uncharacterized protein YlxW (UPF0749 family)